MFLSMNKNSQKIHVTDIQKLLILFPIKKNIKK